MEQCCHQNAIKITNLKQIAPPYAVYFEFDSSELGTEARNIVLDAAKESSKADQITIKIGGHTDRSGPTGYNDTLSFKRAEVVRNEMIGNGVDKNMIIIEAHGERVPTIKTDDGIKERQNRRVTIELN